MSTTTQETKSTCPYCGTGCGVIIESQDGQITGVRGDPDHPANFGKLCTKGSTLHLSAVQTGRALYPELRTSKSAPRQRVGWNLALNHAAEQFAQVIQKHGPDAVAFYVSGQLLTEDYYVFNKLAKGLIGTNNIDSNSRLCMSSAVAGYKATLGADSVPCSYEDFELADLFFLAGSNAAWTHPILFRRMEEARGQSGARMIVVDPRRTDTAASADLHLQILPGTDVVLYSAMLHVLLWEGLADQAFVAAHTEGFDTLRASVRELTPAVAAQICGVKAEDIVTAARWFGQAKAPLSLWCQGLNQSAHGTANNAALIHLHLATGSIGKPGMGPFSLTGQPNAMGGREVGAMANLLSGHRDLSNPAHRQEIAELWGIPSVPEQPGLTAVELFQAVEEGRIKALWIACTNPAHSLPDQTRVRAALARCDFVVVQEAFADTETCAYADLLLPAATWGEKEGTVTNSERRISRVRAAIPAAGEARGDWRIARDFALALGQSLGQAELAQGLFDYPDTASIFAEHARSTRGRDLDLSGIDYPLLEQAGPQTWPRPDPEHPGPARLYGDGRFATPSGKARFLPLGETLAKAQRAEATSARYPFSLNTGRLRDQWHGMSRTGRVAALQAHEAQPRLHLNPGDMARRNLEEGDWAQVSNKRGHSLWQVSARPEIAPAQAYLPMHWGEMVTGTPGANLFTLGATDPVSRQPELKHAAVRIDKVELTQKLVALRTTPVGQEGREQVLIWGQRLGSILPQDGSATLTLAGRERPVLHLQWAWSPEHAAPDLQAERLEQVARALDLPEDQSLVYLDERRGIIKRALVEADNLTGLVFAGETAATGWLLEALVEQRAMQDLKPWLFAPRSQPPAGGISRGRIVCNCMNVGENQIREALAAGATLEVLQTELRCGTGCGACMPELRRLSKQT